MITLENLNGNVTALAKLRRHKDELKQQQSSLQAEIDELEGQISEALEANDLPSFKGSDGTVSRVVKHSFRTPKTEEEKEIFFEFLKEKGVFWDYVSVNSQSLNSFLKGEIEARELQNNFDTTFPGIQEPNERISLTFRKTR